MLRNSIDFLLFVVYNVIGKKEDVRKVGKHADLRAFGSNPPAKSFFAYIHDGTVTVGDTE